VLLLSERETHNNRITLHRAQLERGDGKRGRRRKGKGSRCRRRLRGKERERLVW